MKSVYDYEIDLAGDSAPAKIIRLCGEGKRVLDVGAGPGSISRVLASQKRCSVVCVERDEDCLEALKTFCKDVYKADLDDPSWVEALKTEGLFDVIIVADVLEHLYDPWRTLTQIKTLLAPSGSVLLSIPHSGHRALLAALCESDLSYRDWGLLDRTHIRFFGMKNIRELIDAAGLAIVEAEFVVHAPEAMELSSSWSSISSELRDALSEVPFGDVYQVVARLESATDTRQSIDFESIQVELSQPVKLIAYFLPQFHPVKENDVWWGKGFTEWTNVSKATPLFKNHYQPHLPADLGFYDLRLRENRIAQIELAKKYGIDGFCYYFYWFSGERILEKPLEDMLADPLSEMPFCLCWANENWTRRWDGQEEAVLLAQKYLPGDDEKFIESILPYLRDRRYIKFNGRPLLIVYNPQHLPNPVVSARKWREICREEGVGEIFLVAALVFGNESYHKFEFDASVEFPPHNLQTKDYSTEITEPGKVGCLREYKEVALEYLSRQYVPEGGKAGFRTVFPSWDNTPRTGAHGTVTLNATPENYEVWLSEAIKNTRRDYKRGNRLVFINAWNEWAEGAHLEPDRKYGHKFLESTLRAKFGRSTLTDFPHYGRQNYGPLEVDELRREGDELRREGDELRREGDELRREGDELRREGDELRREGDARKTAIHAVQTAYNNLEAGFHSLQTWHAYKSDEASRLDAEVRNMSNSLSWRLTSPLRSIEKAIRRWITKG